MPGNIYHPTKATRAQCPSERTARTRIGQHTNEAAMTRLKSRALYGRSAEPQAPTLPHVRGIAAQLASRNNCKLSLSGTSPEASAADTSAFSLHFCPVPWLSGPQRLQRPCLFGRAVSSMISLPPSPPTDSSACFHKVVSSGAMSRRPALMRWCSRLYRIESERVAMREKLLRSPGPIRLAI